MTFADKIRLTLQWTQDIESGEIIEARDYSRTYMGFLSVSQKDLTAICKLVNPILEYTGSPWRITNSMGELIPGRPKVHVSPISSEERWRRRD